MEENKNSKYPIRDIANSKFSKESDAYGQIVENGFALVSTPLQNDIDYFCQLFEALFGIAVECAGIDNGIYTIKRLQKWKRNGI